MEAGPLLRRDEAYCLEFWNFKELQHCYTLTSNFEFWYAVRSQWELKKLWPQFHFNFRFYWEILSEKEKYLFSAFSRNHLFTEFFGLISQKETEIRKFVITFFKWYQPLTTGEDSKFDIWYFPAQLSEILKILSRAVVVPKKRDIHTMIQNRC